MKELIGKNIVSVKVSNDQGYILFETNTGNFCYRAIGECCSESWFSDIYNFHALAHATVDSVCGIDIKDYNVADGRCRQEADEVYGYKITTDKGIATIVFRNSSNGYYGGYIELSDDYDDDKGLETITGDWSA